MVETNENKHKILKDNKIVKMKLKTLKQKHAYIEKMVNKHILPYHIKLKYHSYEIKRDFDDYRYLRDKYERNNKHFINHVLDYYSDYVKNEKSLEEDKLNTVINDFRKDLESWKDDQCNDTTCFYATINELETRVNKIKHDLDDYHDLRGKFDWNNKKHFTYDFLDYYSDYVRRENILKDELNTLINDFRKDKESGKHCLTRSLQEYKLKMRAEKILKHNDDVYLKLKRKFLKNYKLFTFDVIEYYKDYVREENIIEEDKLDTIVNDLTNWIQRLESDNVDTRTCFYFVINTLETKINKIGILIPREFPCEKDILYITQTFETLDCSNPCKEMNKRYNDLTMFVNEFYHSHLQHYGIDSLANRDNIIQCKRMRAWSRYCDVGNRYGYDDAYYDMKNETKDGIKYCKFCENNVKDSNCPFWHEDDCVECDCYACVKYKDIACPICEDEEKWFNHICIGIYKGRVKCYLCNKLRRLHQESKHKCGICFELFNSYKKSEVYNPKNFSL